MEQPGRAGEPEELPIPSELVARFAAWQSWYDDHCPEDDIPLRDAEAFSTEGLSIARALKAALPDWTVIYFDEAKRARSHLWDKIHRTTYEYEVRPETKLSTE